MAKKQKNIMFRTNRQSDRGDLKKFAAILTVSVVGILAISIFAILIKHDFDVKSALGGNAETETQAVETKALQSEIEASKTYFFWCADDSSDELRFAWLVNFRLPEREVLVCTLDLDRRITVASDTAQGEEKTDSIRNVFASSGIKELVAYMEGTFGMPIDGYIGSDDESFKSMINYFGGIDITVPEQIEYRSGDFAVILVKGRQNIKGDTLFKYLRYLGTLGERGRSLQAAALNEMLDFVFSSSNLEKRGSFFSRISNTLETDLSIVDFSSCEEGIKVFMENGFALKKTVESPEDLNED